MILTEDILPQGFTEITYRKDLSNYLINTKGEIYSKRVHRILTGTIDLYGYKVYALKSNKGEPVRLRVHIAVAKQFIPNHDRSKTFVNHIDENKANPDVHNLEWVTPKENSNHGTCRKRGGDKRKKPVAEYDFNGNYIRTWASVRDVIRFYADLWDCDKSKMKGIETSLYANLKGDLDTSHGRVWRYADNKAPKRITVTEKMVFYARCSKSKLKLDYQGKVPDEYLHHEMTKDDIIEYFLAHERLTASEKSMIRKLGGKKYVEV
jgi:hypothetical protein